MLEIFNNNIVIFPCKCLLTVLVPDGLGQGDLVQFLVGKCICFPGKDIRMHNGKEFLISETENSLFSQPLMTCSRGVCDV